MADRAVSRFVAARAGRMVAARDITAPCVRPVARVGLVVVRVRVSDVERAEIFRGATVRVSTLVVATREFVVRGWDVSDVVRKVRSVPRTAANDAFVHIAQVIIKAINPFISLIQVYASKKLDCWARFNLCFIFIFCKKIPSDGWNK